MKRLMIMMAALFLLSGGTNLAGAMPPAPSGTGDGPCVTCDDCFEGFTAANGGTSCQATQDSKTKACLQCQVFGTCRYPVAIGGGACGGFIC